MTPRQAQFLAFILRYTRQRGIAQSFEEIASHFGTSSPSVNGMIKTLERATARLQAPRTAPIR